MLEEIRKLRKELHQNPELSGQESNTAKRIKEFIETHHNTEIIENIGGNGLAAVYDYPEQGPSIMIRCELDALPINEENTFDYRSKTMGVSHKCGHDGHMAIVAGLIFWIKEQPFTAGKVILLFQPAEETGEGGYKVFNDEKFEKLNPDYIFALHNLPGKSLHTIFTKKASFSATVQSMTVALTGKESHASEPENGINPALAISEIINDFSKLNITDTNDEKFTLLTPVHISMGQKSYGISPGKGELHFTLRTWSEKVMKRLEENINQILLRICENHHLTFAVDWFEYFPATVNDASCNQLVMAVAIDNGLIVRERTYPLKFGEDFGWFSQKYKVAMFGLGAGINCPALHHADYDFPEEIIETGMHMFKGIITKILK